MSLSGEKEAISMGSRIDRDISMELREGTKVTCLKCGKGIYKPAGADYKTAHSFLSVSYTHLDVYKRQFSGSIM